MSDFPFNTNLPSVDGARLADWTDGELLHVYAEMQAEQALREIVVRHGGMVYSICRRVLGNHHEAEDAAQVTLLLFCRKARGLSRSTSLPGWLAVAARTTALDARRRALAQRRRDSEVARSEEMFPQNDSATEPEVVAHLDEALGSLPAKYRDAVVLRYMTGLSENETAEALGCPRSTATSRVLRGLEKMQKFLSRRGYALAPAAVASLLGKTQAAMPAGLATQIVASCTGKAVVSSAVLTALKAVEAMMFWAKAKTMAAVAACLVMAGVGTTVVVKEVILAATPNPHPRMTGVSGDVAAPARVDQGSQAESAGTTVLPDKLPLGPMVEQHALQLYTDIQQQMSAWGPEWKDYDKFKDRIAARSDDVQSLIWETDRHPLDVLLRWTEALWRDIRRLGGGLGKELEPALATLKKRVADDQTGERELFVELCVLNRRIALSNPLVDFDSLIFTGYDVNGYAIYIQHCASAGVLGPRGGLYQVSGFKGDQVEVRDLLESVVAGNGRWKGEGLSNRNPLRNGRAIFQMAALSYDARWIVFAWAERPALGKGAARWPSTCYHLFKVRPDGSELTQLTDSLYNDTSPCWLPDGRIVFTSDRLHHAIRCGANQPCNNLCSMKSDGTDLYPLSWHETSEEYPSVDNDGMLVYTRWDYIDRNAVQFHNMWRCYPDGRDPRAPHGNYGSIGPAEVSIRAVPGTSGKYTALSSGHHCKPFGNLMLIDVNVRDRSPGNARVFWPGLQPGGDFIGNRDNRPAKRCFCEPTPLSEDYCIVGDVAGKTILLVDKFGNEVLLLDTREILGDLPPRSPVPLKLRRVPPAIPTQTYQGQRREMAPKATIAVMNVYESDFQWPAGTRIKALRIFQTLAKPWPLNRDIWTPPIGYGSAVQPRVVLGTVPVEDDGSACFEAPVERQIYFQALNADGMAVQTMLSGTYVHPGEHLSCAGCHEERTRVARTVGAPKAMQRPPSRIELEPGGAAPVNYGSLVKPVFDRHCADCHRKENKGTSFDYYKFVERPGPGEKRPEVRSYGYGDQVNHYTCGDLWKYVKYYGSWPPGSPDRGMYAARSTPGIFGALGSELTKYLEPSHYGVKLTPEEKRQVIVWMDAGAIGLGSYFPENEAIARQLGGELIWPTMEVDPLNPTGVQQEDTAVIQRLREGHDAAEAAQHMSSPSAWHRREAVRALARLGPGPWVDRLKTMVDRDADDGVRAAAIRALDAAEPAGQGQAFLLDVLRGLADARKTRTGSPAEAWRRYTALIGELTDYRGARDAMVGALKSEGQAVREAAAELLMVYWPDDRAGLDPADLAAVGRARVADLEGASKDAKSKERW